MSGYFNAIFVVISFKHGDNISQIKGKKYIKWIFFNSVDEHMTQNVQLMDADTSFYIW